jgi:hypothetical protein
MRLTDKTYSARGIAAFFFFSWIIQLLWNSILVDQLALAAVKLTYWQAAGLWFLATLLFAWVGIGVQPWTRRRRDWKRVGDQIKRTVRRRVSRWIAEDEASSNVDELGDRIEAKIKRGFSRWVGVDEEIDWDDLGEHIERKIKRKIRDWAEDD